MDIPDGTSYMQVDDRVAIDYSRWPTCSIRHDVRSVVYSLCALPRARMIWHLNAEVLCVTGSLAQDFNHIESEPRSNQSFHEAALDFEHLLSVE